MSKTTIFLDESGKPEIYSAKGVNLVSVGAASKYLVLATVRTSDQLDLLKHVMDFKISLLKDDKLKAIFSPAYTLDAFHATADYAQIKEQFYEFINTLDVKIDVIVVDKLKCYPSLQEKPNRMYSVMAGQLIKNIAHQSEEVEVIFSRKDSKLKIRSELQTEVDRIRLEYLSKHPSIDNNKVHISYQHNPHYTHAGLQIADYVAYAVFQHFEFNKPQYLSIIQNKIGKIHDICNKKYFTQSNPLQLSI